LPTLDHLRDDLGRILEIGVDHDHRGAASVIDTGAQRHLVAEVAREVDDADAVVAGHDALEELERAVGAAIVDVDDLEVEVRQTVEGRAQAAMELLDPGFLLVHGRDDGDQRTIRGHAHSVSDGTVAAPV
jgi:hypothetical protein